MDNIIQGMLFLAVLTGIILVVVSLISLLRKKEPSNNFTDYFEADNTIKAIDLSISEADKTIEELNKLAAHIMDEMNNKYQELIFLYNLIDEKKKELVKDIYPSEHGAAVDYTVNNSSKQSFLSPRYKEITELSKKGFSIQEISQKLNIGQGEIKMIIDLGKQR